MKDLQDLVIEAIENLNSEQMMELNNRYCAENNYPDIIYHNDDEFLNEYFTCADLARSISYGSYSYNDSYAQINGQGNLDSYDYLDSEVLVDRVGVIADYIIENEDLFCDLINLQDLKEDDE